MSGALALLLAGLLASSIDGVGAEPTVLERCVEQRGMQFCAAIDKVPREGEFLELTLTTRNLGPGDVSAISLAKVPEAERADFVGVWSGRKRVPSGRPRLRPQYVVLLSPGSSITAVARSHYRVTAGRNEVLVDQPYWWPDEAFSEADARAFFEHAWNAPKASALIGPLIFEVN